MLSERAIPYRFSNWIYLWRDTVFYDWYRVRVWSNDDFWSEIMSGEFTTELKTVKARKEHDCDCYQRVMESGYAMTDFDEKYHYELSRLAKNKGKIEVGEEHFEWSGCFDGEMFTAKANKAMHDLVCEMGWFD